MARIAAARRYAQAVFMIAKERGEMEAWQRDLAEMAQVVSAPDLQALLTSPRLPVEEKIKLLRQSLAGLNPLVLNLASLLVQKGRIGLANDIADEYHQLYDVEMSVEHAEVVTAVPLDEAARERIVRGLEAITGKQVVIETRVDPRIIGGLVARLGDRVLDASVQSQLQSLKRSLVGG